MTITNKAMPNLIERLDALSEALYKATPGPYVIVTGKNISVGPCPGKRVACCNYDNGPIEKANAAAIAESINFLREHIPTLREALRDGGRYRFLRARGPWKSDPHGWVVWPIYKNGSWIENIYPEGERLDAAIDAAIDQERGDRLGRDGGGE